jgi:hypothetical protein
VSSGSSISVVSQAVTCGIVTSRRHLPTCITSGTSVPAGTPSSRNSPASFVSATATPRAIEPEHLSQVAPSWISG